MDLRDVLKKKPELLESYNNIFKEYLTLGIFGKFDSETSKICQAHSFQLHQVERL